MNWYAQDEQAVEATLQTDMHQGLSEREARKRLNQVGFNQLKDHSVISPFAILLGQFKDVMVLVLLGATLISVLLGEYTVAITISAVAIINGMMGFFQEYKAEKSLHALKELTAPTAHVIREGVLTEIPAAEIVPGDIIYFEAGDRVPADVRLFEAKGLFIEESALTGESVPVNKEPDAIADDDNVGLGDQHNMAFMGTLVTQGSGQGIVVETGMSTQMGEIAELISTTESRQTPLQMRLEQLGKVLISVALILTAVVVVTGIWHGQDTYQMFLAGVSLAVAAIPEGLPAIVTIALALGVQRMIRRRAIVRKLPSVETLGCASVICSDKTGTLTQNKMTVTHLWIDQTSVEVSGVGYQPEGEFTINHQIVSFKQKPHIQQMLEYGVLCNNAILEKETDQNGGLFKQKSVQWDITGDPTEGALVVAGAKAGVWKEQLDQLYERLDEFPFDSSRKMMSVLIRNAYGEKKIVSKGAPDVLIERCDRVLWNGRITPLNSKIKASILAANDDQAGMALRTLGIAYRDVKRSEMIEHEAEAERDLIFVGLFGMIDPPREEVKQAISECKRAGIKTVMITGDHQKTAEAIASQLGILNNGKVINGRQLQTLTDEEFAREVEHISVYARVSPEHKLRIVKALQAKGHVVAMTGDGVNDAPAIKQSDIGIAMGITGTDVAKEASSLILSDDNFATIKAAIEEGRTIYENIRKFIRYMLASNVGEILVMFFAMLLALPLPLVPIQILWVNLVTDGLPAMALGVDRSEGNVMAHPPRRRKESIFSRGLGWKIVSRGFLIGWATLAAFWLTLQNEPDHLVKAQTVAFSTLVMAQLIHVFDCRSEKSIFSRNPFENKWLIAAVVLSVIMLVGVIYIEALQPVFRTVALSTREWLFVLFFAALPSIALSLFHRFGPKHA